MSAKPWNDNNDDNYNDDGDDKDVIIASASKKNDDHNVIFFAPVAVTIAVADKGVICPRRCPLTLMPLHRRRGGDPSWLKPWSTDDNEDNNTSIARVSKNDEDHLWSLLGLRMMVEPLAQPEAKRQRQRRRRRRRQQEATQQPAGANEVGGQGWTREVAHEERAR